MNTDNVHGTWARMATMTIRVKSYHATAPAKGGRYCPEHEKVTCTGECGGYATHESMWWAGDFDEPPCPYALCDNCKKPNIPFNEYGYTSRLGYPEQC